MRIYEIYNPKLDLSIKYKVLPPEDIEQFMMWQLENSSSEYIENVLEYMIYNLRPEITSILKSLPKEEAGDSLIMLYNGCVMLNPGLDVEKWNILSHNDLFKYTHRSSHPSVVNEENGNKKIAQQNLKRLTRPKLAMVRNHLEKTVIGQSEAINEILSMLTRNAVGLGEQNRPMGVFLFSGSSGVGKTLLAKELHNSIFGMKTQIVRLDCGEYQHKHENQKILGAPNGYLSHDEGGQLTNALLKQPNTVLLLDEVEKAHPDIWNTFLTAFDEGFMTDSQGKKISLQNVIVIMTTNLGNDKIVDRMTRSGIGFSKEAAGFIEDINARQIPREEIEKLSKKAIREKFSPEFQNRIDKVVIFNHLSKDNMLGIAKLELDSLDQKLSKRGYKLCYQESAVIALAKNAQNPIQGARSISRIRRDVIENSLAEILISHNHPKNTTFALSYEDKFNFEIIKPGSQKELLAIFNT